jgi:aminoglycoside phosphotransferase family enzyme
MSRHASDVSLADKIGALRDPAAYPEPCATVAIIETHFACVFLAGDFAYKLKRPVRVERMDFRDAAARERNCREELRLNRRLAPTVYLNVVPLTIDADDRLRVNGCGTAVDWLVKMRRLPADRMLDHAILAGTAKPADIRPAALWLAQFYRDQPPVLLSGSDYLARLHARVDDVREELLAADLQLDRTLVESAHQQQLHFLLQHVALVQARALDGKVVEGHGDLRPEHIFLGSALDAALPLAACVIDSLEFDRDLRIFDSAEELAFLSLECERLNADSIAQEFVRVYRSVTQDNFPAEIFVFYRAQRALTRAKIAAWHVRDPEVSALADWHALATGYLHNALQSAQVGN